MNKNKNNVLFNSKSYGNQFSYKVSVSAGATTTPKWTFVADAPPAYTDWGDGTARSLVTSGVEQTHAYIGAGEYTVTLIMANQAKWLAQVDINYDWVTTVSSPIQQFKALVAFVGFLNIWVQNISNWQLPPGMQTFSITYNPSLSGSLSGWVLPSTLYSFDLSVTTLSGDNSNWVIPGTTYKFNLESSSIVGCPVLSSMVAIELLLVSNCALTQAQVDLYLSRCVAREAATTYATPILDLSGTNAVPSAAGLLDKATLIAAGWEVCTNDPTRVVGILGDSIEVGTYTVNWVYKTQLTYAMTTKNHAAGGASIIYSMDSQTAASASDDADIIIICLGTNDDNAGNMTTLQAEIEENILELQGTNPSATIYYMNVLPRWTNSGGVTVVDKSNIRTAVAAACTARGIVCWDTFTSPWINASDTSDGLHPNTSGRDKIAAAVIALLP